MADDGKSHSWTNDETRALIEWRAANEKLFTGRRNSSKSGWEDFVVSSGLNISAKQAKKKWNNLKDKYKELRDPPTGKGVEAGGVTAATWQWYSLMDAALQGQHSISPPLVVAANLTTTSGGTVTSPASSPSTSCPSAAETPGREQSRKRSRESGMLEFLKEDREREERREREALARQEERERAAAERAERYLMLFHKLIEKF